jgi:signal transduction histidine kinase
MMNALTRRRPWLRSTVRFRLAALYVALFLVAGAGTLAVIYFLFRDDSSQSVIYHGSARVVSTQTATTYTGTALVRFAPGPKHGGLARTRRAATQPYTATVHTVPVRVRIPKSEVLRIQHAADLHRLLIESAVAFALMTIAASVIGWLFAGRVLRPLRAITATARRLSSSDLQERLAFDGPRDELRELADTFDGFLARLEAAFEAQRRFVHHASHELRTPLARQRTLLEVALADPDATVNSLRNSCTRVLATEQEQERLIDGLLTLARSEEPVDQRRPVALDAVVSGLIELRSGEIARRELQISAELTPARTSGDEALLERLVANLLDNAIEHNVSGGKLSVSTGTQAGTATLRVLNSGPILSEDDLALLVQPLEHRQQSPTAVRAHHGLGLTIVQSVVAAHGASIVMRCREGGGMDIVVELPALAHAGGGPTRAVSN